MRASFFFECKEVDVASSHLVSCLASILVGVSTSALISSLAYVLVLPLELALVFLEEERVMQQ